MHEEERPKLRQSPTAAESRCSEPVVPCARLSNSVLSMTHLLGGLSRAPAGDTVAAVDSSPGPHRRSVTISRHREPVAAGAGHSALRRRSPLASVRPRRQSRGRCRPCTTFKQRRAQAARRGSRAAGPPFLARRLELPTMPFPCIQHNVLRPMYGIRASPLSEPGAASGTVTLGR